MPVHFKYSVTLDNCWCSGSSLSGHSRKRTAYDRLHKIPFELPYIQTLYLLIPVSGRGHFEVVRSRLFLSGFLS